MGMKELDPRIKKISERIRQLRIDAGYTSYETFANEKNLPRMQYWRAETGANLTLQTLLKIADAHGIGLSELIGKTGSK